MKNVTRRIFDFFIWFCGIHVAYLMILIIAAMAVASDSLTTADLWVNMTITFLSFSYISFIHGLPYVIVFFIGVLIYRRKEGIWPSQQCIRLGLIPFAVFIIIFSYSGFISFDARAIEANPDQKFALAMETRLKFPANGFINPSIDVRLKLRSTKDSTIIDQKIISLLEDSDFDSRTIIWTDHGCRIHFKRDVTVNLNFNTINPNNEGGT